MARYGNLKTNNLYIGRSGTLGSKSPTQVTATATQLNAALNNTATVAEVNLLDNMWASVATTFVDGTDGTGTAQFVFKDAAGTTMATTVAGSGYISEVGTGLTVDLLDDGLAADTNGVLTLAEAGVFSNFEFVTTAAGLLGIDLQGNADSYWVVFKHPTGKLVISDECAVTG